MVEDCMNMDAQITDISVVAVPPEMVGLIWHKVEPHIKKTIAQAPEELSLFTIQNRLVTGEHILIVCTRGVDVIAAITAAVEVTDAGKRILFLPVVGGGEMDQWLAPFMEVINAIAQDFNCSVIRGVSARSGWVKALNSSGFPWEERYIMIETKVV